MQECLSHFLPVSGLSDPVLGSRLILHVVESGGGGEGEKVGWLATFYTLLASEPGYVLGWAVYWIGLDFVLRGKV